MRALFEVLLLICLIPIISCYDKKGNESHSDNKYRQKLNTIQIPGQFKNAFLTDEQIENLRIVPLETNANSLIGEITQLLVFKDKYYIEDFPNKSIIVFNSEGNYLFKIHQPGRGPGEYMELRDFKIDEDNNILVLDFNKIIYYDSTGKYIKNIKFNFLNDEALLNPLQFIPLKNREFYFWRGSFGIKSEQNQKLFGLYRISGNKITNQYFEIKRSIPGGQNRFFKNLHNGYYMQSFQGNDTIFLLSGEGVLPAFYVDFGKRKIPNGLLPFGFEGIGEKYYNLEQQGYCFGINNILESKTYLYFTFTCLEGWGMVLYSYYSGSTVVSEFFYNRSPTSMVFKAFNQQKDEYISVMDDYYMLSDVMKTKTDTNQLSRYDKQLLQEVRNKNQLLNPFLIHFKLRKF